MIVDIMELENDSTYDKCNENPPGTLANSRSPSTPVTVMVRAHIINTNGRKRRSNLALFVSPLFKLKIKPVIHLSICYVL